MKLISMCCNSTIDFLSYNYVASPNIMETTEIGTDDPHEYRVTMFFKCQKCGEELKLIFDSYCNDSVDFKTHMILIPSTLFYYEGLHSSIENLGFKDKLKLLFRRTKK